jgi:hypothetical protein
MAVAEPVTTLSPADLVADIYSGAEYAYKTLAEKGLAIDQVHRMQICYEATDLLLKHLLERGYNARHEIHTGEDRLGDQNYVVVETPEGREVVADPTWQLYVPDENITLSTPKVLLGTREEAIATARAHGVSENKLKLWERHSVKMSVQEQKQADREAEEAAEKAAQDGSWEKFVKAN